MSGMRHLRGRLSERNQDETEAYLREFCLNVQRYGQDLLSPGIRELLRSAPNLDRWKADYMVRTEEGVTMLADAKFAFAGTGNHSIEMRSLLTASREELPTIYVCSMWTGEEFVDFTSILALHVPTTWPCCAVNFEQFQSSSDARVVNAALDEYCPATERTVRSSGTPYFVVPGTALTSFERACRTAAPKPDVWNMPQQRQLDWRNGNHYRAQELACVLCGWPTRLRDDNGAPSHKTCAENVTSGEGAH